MKQRMGFLSIFLVILTFGLYANAQVPIVFQQGLAGYMGVHDTYYMTGDPAAINGTETAFEWDGSDAGGLNFGMIRFDDVFGTNPGQVPPDAKILSAVLTLYVTNNGASDQIATMHELLNPFDETLDFFEFGDHSGGDPLPTTDYVEEPIVEIPGPATGVFLNLDATEYFKKVQSGGNNYGLVFIPGGSDGVGIASSEAASNRPKLTITIEGVAPAGSRTITKIGFSANESIPVSINITLSAGSQDITVVETLPTDWSAEAISDGGVLASGKITWTLNGFTGTKTLTYAAKAPAVPKGSAKFSGVINDSAAHIISIDGSNAINFRVPLYKTGNVLAIGVWNESNTSSDLTACADLSDNNGVIYVQDTSADGGWPAGTIFRWKTVLYDDGTGAEEPGWYLRDFANDTEANLWIEQTDVGFSIGHGGNDGENGETLLDASEETVYTRSIFNAKNYETIVELTLKLEGDDAALAWLNGIYIGYAGAGNSDRGEMPPDYVFDTTTNPDSGGVEANPSTYTQSEARTFVIPVTLIDAEPVSVSEWALY